MIAEKAVGTVLTGIPKGWVTWDYELRDRSTLVASLYLDWMLERARCTISGRSWELARESWLAGSFQLKQGGRVCASAEKPNLLFRSFVVKFDSKTYRWEAESAFARTFRLFDGEQCIGSMRPETVFTRRATIELPDEFSPERKAFLVWLALLIWRRQKK